MSREEMLIRTGFYAGCASKYLGDDSYALQVLGRAQDVTEEEYFAMAHEIQQRLLAAGVIGPDEDPYEDRRT